MTRLRAILNFIRFTKWVDEPEWTGDDARALGSFMRSEHGVRFAAILRNMTIRQDSSAVQKVDLTACGFAIGFRSAVAVIDSLGIDATHPAGGADD